MSVKINGYPIDLALSEEFSAQTEITQYPIEKGSFNSDHMRNLPEELSFEGVVSDTPIGAIAADPSRQDIEGGVLPSKDAYNRLIAIREATEPVVIECSLGRFEDMGLVQLSVPRTSKTGKGLIFTASFQKMRFVTNNRTTVKVKTNCGGKQNLGNKESQEWGKNFGLPGRRFVVSYGTFARQSVIKSYGQPILTTTHIERLQVNGSDDYSGERDHYEIRGDTKPDGYIDSFFGKNAQGEGLFPAGKQVYHRFRITAGSNEFAFKGQTKPLEHELNGRPVHFDENEKAWVDDENGQVVRKMTTRDRSTPEKAREYNDEKWRGVTYGKNLPGGGIQ